MKILSFIGLILFSGHVLAQGFSLVEKRERCYSLLVNEFQNIMANDNGLIQAQLTLTGMKLAKRIAQKNLEEAASISTLDQYIKNMVDSDFIGRLNQDSEGLDKIAQMYRSYQSQNHRQILPSLEVFQALRDLLASERVSDQGASVLMMNLQELEREGNDEPFFNENDSAIAWFINQASLNFNGENSHYLSQIVSTAFGSPHFQDPVEREKFMAENMASAKLKIKAELAKLKERVFEANREYCLSDYENDFNSQNNSVFLSCRQPEEEIINKAFLESIHNILRNEEPIGLESRLNLLDTRDRQLSSGEIRRVQDHLNSEEFSDKERVIEYYRRGVYPDDGNCQTFTIVDKRSQTTSVYTVDGEEIFTTNSIQAYPREGEGAVVFNPDGELRRFENGTYTRTTSAGVFYNILDMEPAERQRRKYDEEFDDRVFVISPREYRNGQYHYNDSTTIALHGVPINNWVDNANERLASFEGGNRNLSTGCVNLEGYAFDMINELSQNRCPMYILPEDENNYFHIKNRELSFSTGIESRKDASEPAKKCSGGSVVLNNGNPECEGGEWVDDPNNVNRYYFSPLSREIYHSSYRVGSANGSPVVEALWQDRERLINQVVANNIDGEDFEDLVSLAYAATSDPGQAEAKFKDLYNAFHHLKSNGVNFDFMNVNEKREAILEYYLDPNGLEKNRREAGKSVYSEVERTLSQEELLERSHNVSFIHER